MHSIAARHRKRGARHVVVENDAVVRIAGVRGGMAEDAIRSMRAAGVGRPG